MMDLILSLGLLLAAQRAPELLERHCVKCHDAGRKKGDLDLSTREGILKAAVPGNSRDSRLYRSIAHLEDPRMPHKAPKLAEAEIAAIAAWIDAGAKYDRTLTNQAPVETHWAFAPLRKGSLQALEKGESVDRRKLIRRAAFDLVGLPPTPEEIDAFVGDPAPDAWERRVDCLLASPHYGERWGRHWLDVARYADSSGYESDHDRKTMHAYRDAVIRALNEDLPFDRFVQWQLAGDEMEPDHPLALALTGFLTCGPEASTTPTDSRRNREKYRMDELDDIVSTTGSAMLGLTVGCARCHDHKYDPVSSKEYYRLAAAFISTKRQETPLSPPHRKLQELVEAVRSALREERIAALPIPEEHREVLRQPVSQNNALSASLHKAHPIPVSDDDVRRRMTPEERARWDALAQEAKGAPPMAHAIANGPDRPAFWLERGDVELKKEEVRVGFPAILTREKTRSQRPRIALAQWIVDVDSGAGGLLARVIANRVWQHHFGEPLVATPSDFGTQGDRPSDPELLDGLASALIANGWSLKALHKLILMSPRYRSSRKPVRLEAEILRDSILAVSGRLNLEMFGPAVKLRIPAEAIVTRSKDDYPKNIREGPEHRRRSVYVFVKRSVAVPFLEVNDAPPASASCGKRACTTVAPQALSLLNEPFVRDAAKAFASRAGDHVKAFEIALGRLPGAKELEAARRLDLVDFCHVLFTLNEFAYVD